MHSRLTKVISYGYSANRSIDVCKLLIAVQQIGDLKCVN